MTLRTTADKQPQKPNAATPIPEIEEEVKQEEATIKKMLTLQFPSGFSFIITVTPDEMIVEAKMRDKQAFFMDQIPRSFIRDLKNMLQEF